MLQKPRRGAPTDRIRGFPPVAAPDACVLVLGSMPSVASLTAGEYYAHSRNAFWPLMTRLLGIDAGSSYEARLAALRQARIALWDVLHSCRREGSLDAAIEEEEENDFAAFLAAHARIRAVLFNGAKSEAAFRARVLARGIGEGLASHRLPSTSPANASWSFARKLEAWREALVRAGATIPDRGGRP
jgi:hypoxanthine-DNA glycosylase